MQESFCQIGNFKEIKSDLTGHILQINLSETHFQIPVSANMTRVRSIGDLQEIHWKSITSSAFLARGEFLAALRNFSSVQTVDDFKYAIERLLRESIKIDQEAKNRQSLRGARARAIDLLMRLWAEHLLAWPTIVPSYRSKILMNYNEFTLMGHLDWFNEICNASASHSLYVRRRCGTIVLRRVLTTIGVMELGDLTPCIFDIARWKGVERNFQGALKAVMTAQKQRYGKAVVFPSSRWSKPLTGSVIDISFSWAIDRNPALKNWVELFTYWIEKATCNLVMRRTVAVHFLNYLLDLKGQLPDPIQYCRRDYHPNVSFTEWINSKNAHISLKHRSKVVNGISELFDMVLDTKLTLEDDFGRPVISPEHYNPVTRLKAPNDKAQTHREAMPIRYINELVGILTENDFEWPKRQLTDYFSWYNEVTGEWERIWSPVRVVAMLIKLHLPLRTIQVRMLDSGECDHEIYRSGSWIANNGPLAPHGSFPIVSRGFLRRFEDRKVKRTFTGFYINTNKTANRLKEPEHRGYEIPWQYDEVIAWSEMLRDWQMKYNVIDRPLNWGEVNERELLVMHTPQSLSARGDISFLFRDPCAADRRYPVRASRLGSFWKLLLDELERRVFERGERLPDGSKIFFIKTRSISGTPTSPVYDLHSLRVSLLTAYATDGGVPIDILSKCIAGHASILMTIYYIKTGPAYITEQLSLAQERIADKEKDNLLRFMMDAKLDEIEEAIAFSDRSATQAITETNPGSWVVNDKGICPVGGNHCSIGGPKVTNIKTQSTDYSPVPGGGKNCVRCRFFVTGPAFLGGMVAHFNSIGYELMDVSRRYRQQSSIIQDIEEKMLAAQNGDESLFSGKKLDLAYERQDQLMKEVDELAAGWHSAYKLIERCKAIMAKKRQESSVNLVLAGTQQDMEVAIQLTSDFELANAICQVANVYPSEDTTLANLRRSRILDAMLARNSCKPVFISLSEEEAIRVGNEFVSFLQARMGYADTAALMDGRRMMDMSGIAKEAKKLLESLTGQSVSFSSLVKAQCSDTKELGK